MGDFHETWGVGGLWIETSWLNFGRNLEYILVMLSQSIE